MGMYPDHIFLWEQEKRYPNIILKYFPLKTPNIQEECMYVLLESVILYNCKMFFTAPDKMVPR